MVRRAAAGRVAVAREEEARAAVREAGAATVKVEATVAARSAAVRVVATVVARAAAAKVAAARAAAARVAVVWAAAARVAAAKAEETRAAVREAAAAVVTAVARAAVRVVAARAAVAKAGPAKFYRPFRSTGGRGRSGAPSAARELKKTFYFRTRETSLNVCPVAYVVIMSSLQRTLWYPARSWPSPEGCSRSASAVVPGWRQRRGKERGTGEVHSHQGVVDDVAVGVIGAARVGLEQHLVDEVIGVGRPKRDCRTSTISTSGCISVDPALGHVRVYTGPCQTVHI